MAVVEPTAAEGKNLNDLQALLTWAGVPGNVRHPGTAAGALVKLLELHVPARDSAPTAADALAQGLTALVSGNTIELLQWQLVVQMANIDTEDFRDILKTEWLYNRDVPPDSPDVR